MVKRNKWKGKRGATKELRSEWQTQDLDYTRKGKKRKKNKRKIHTQANDVYWAKAISNWSPRGKKNDLFPVASLPHVNLPFLKYLSRLESKSKLIKGKVSLTVFFVLWDLGKMVDIKSIVFIQKVNGYCSTFFNFEWLNFKWLWWMIPSFQTDFLESGRKVIRINWNER